MSKCVHLACISLPWFLNQFSYDIVKRAGEEIAHNNFPIDNKLYTCHMVRFADFLYSFLPWWQSWSTYRNLFKRIWTYLNLSEHIWTYLNLSKPIGAYLNLSKPVWTYLNLSEPIQTNMNLSTLIQTYLKSTKHFPLGFLEFEFWKLLKKVHKFLGQDKHVWIGFPSFELR